MLGDILKRLTYSALISIWVSLVLGFIAINETEGHEAKQGMAIVRILSVATCLVSYVLSTTALLNLKKGIRQNNFVSALSFILAPTLILFGFVFLIFKDSNSRVEFWDTAVIITPVIVHILALGFHFRKFREDIKHFSE